MDDGFVTFHSKRSKWLKKKPLVSRSLLPTDEQQQDDQIVQQARLKLSKFVDIIRDSGLGRYVANLLKKSYEIDGSGSKMSQTICLTNFISYALGSFSQCNESLFQLALLVFLKRNEIVKAEDWLVYDPVFNSNERIILQIEGLQLLDFNDCGFRKITGQTIFYLPRCPLPLIHNVLWSNLTSLSSIKIIGNSLSSIEQSLTEDRDRSQYYVLDYIISSKSYEEAKLPVNEMFSDAFYGISFHSFLSDNISPSFLVESSKKNPTYLDDAFSSEFILHPLS